MSTAETSSPWDFTPVINLLHSFSNTTQPPSEPAKGGAVPFVAGGDNGREGCQKLGDFGPIWDLLSGATSLEPKLPSANIETRPDTSGLTNDLGAGSRQQTSPTEPLSKPNNDGRVRILLKRQVEEKKKEGAKVRPNHFPLSDASDEDAPPKPKPLFSILKNTGRLVIDEPTVAPTRPSPPSHNKRKSSPTRSKKRIEPLIKRSPTERKLNLISLLHDRFPTERESLLSLHVSTTRVDTLKTNPTGVHVFVDMSNISIGFHDCIKIARNVPISVRVPRVPLSFHNFSLILERGRPTNKRVLVGSDRFAAIDEAEQIGYEINILERVHKAKDFTPRKKKFAGGNGNDRANGMGNNAHAQGHSSGSETNTGVGPERWVEQAVDEILHLKILESLVDTEVPSTIVLATGDAAEAEYSDGFLKMVERALQKGWAVELVSFSSTTSRAYRRKEFRSQWGAQFRIIHLDEYVEHLLDA
ncbi:hypothetical protein FQN52_002956 [Onygenales sp. PD_12]|nr:hypothetical protein FQN52_002956 [Onygenales sp. PD_12]KAK2796404.1 hypothetical protein FQN51_009388 [Onygenales sp. PD_10]